MFDIIKANVTPYQAKKLYPNNWVVLLYPNDSDDDDTVVTGDLIYVGDELYK